MTPDFVIVDTLINISRNSARLELPEIPSICPATHQVAESERYANVASTSPDENALMKALTTSLPMNARVI